MISINGVEFKVTYNEELSINQAYVVGGNLDWVWLEGVIDQVERDFNVQVIF